MGLLNLLPKSPFGFGGKKPPFDIAPNPPGSLHNTYSADGIPSIRLTSTLPGNPIPLPSKLDEADPSNTSKFKSKKGFKYTDNLPK
jgi:hypothetical protein